MMREFVWRLAESTKHHRRRTRPGGLGGVCSLIEPLEDRCLLSAHVAGAVAGEAPGHARQSSPDFVSAVQRIEDTTAQIQAVAGLQIAGDRSAPGLLLPAIQKVNEPAGRGPDGNRAGGARSENFILPAVQNVQDAGARARNGFELPAIQNVQAAFDRLQGGGDMTDPPGDDSDPPPGQDDGDPTGGTPDGDDPTSPPTGDNPGGSPNDEFDPPTTNDEPEMPGGSPDDDNMTGPMDDADFDLPMMQDDEDAFEDLRDAVSLTSLLNDDFDLLVNQIVRNMSDSSTRLRGEDVLIALPDEDAAQPVSQHATGPAARIQTSVEQPADGKAHGSQPVGLGNRDLASPLVVDAELPAVPTSQEAANSSRANGEIPASLNDDLMTSALETEDETAEVTRAGDGVAESGDHSFIGLLLGAIAGFLTTWALRTETGYETAAQRAFASEGRPSYRRRRFRRRR